MTTGNQIIDNIDFADFKSMFFRGLNFLPEWLESKTYFKDKIVYYTPTENFYKCLNNAVTSFPTNTTDWAITGDVQVEDFILDVDIQNAFEIGYSKIKLNLPDNIIKKAFLLLSAHYLVIYIRAEIDGIESKGEYTVNSQSVGSVSVSYAQQDFMIKDDLQGFYAKSSYGVLYYSLIKPYLIGQGYLAIGGTTP